MIRNKIITYILLFFLISSILVVVSPTSLASSYGAIGNNIRSDGSYLYMTMEDGTLPYWSEKRANHTLDANNTIEGKYCENITYDYSQTILYGVLYEKYIYDNPIKPSTWSCKIIIRTGTSDTFTRLSIQNSFGTQIANILFYSDKTIKSIVSNSYTFTSTWNFDTIYTITFSNIDYDGKTYDITLSNATSSETKTGMIFYNTPSGYSYRITKFVLDGVDAADTKLYLDDWTVGTQSNINTGSNSPEENNATISGTLINDGSPLQNATQSNHSITLFYSQTLPITNSTTNVTITDTYYANSTSTQTISKLITGLTVGQLYYYTFKINTSYTNGSSYWFGDNNSFLTKPEAPTSTSFTFINSTAINLSWTKGIGANRTIIVSGISGMPNSISDGTVIYNGTASYYVKTITAGTSYYLRAWSYANWSNPNLSQYSDNHTDFNIGGLYINCYDEITFTNLTFNVSIINSDGSQVYNAWNCVNTKTINVTLCPQGQVNVVISSPNYTTRLYTLFIQSNIFYLLNTFLPHTDTTVQTNVSRLYLIRVVGVSNEPINNVYVQIKGYNNLTGIYETVTNGYTDGAGEITADLYPNTMYLITISKTDYQTNTSIYIPDPLFYGLFYPKILRLYPAEYIPPSYDYFLSDIILYANMSTISDYNGVISIFYQDLNSSTINLAFYMYDAYNNTYNLVNSSTSTNNIYSVTYYNVNTTHPYELVLFYNNTASYIDYPVYGPYSWLISSIAVYTEADAKNFNTIVTNVIGPFTINGIAVPWGDIAIAGIAIFFMFTFGLLSIGVGLITGGFMIGLMQALFKLWHFTDIIQPNLTLCIPILIVGGIIYMMTRYSSEEVL